MIRLLMQRGAHPQTATHMLIGYFGRKPIQRRMISLDSEPEQQKGPVGRFRSLGNRVAHLTKDLGNPKVDVNKSVDILTTKVGVGFSQVGTGFADVNKLVGVLTTKVGVGFSQAETRFSQVETRFAAVDRKLVFLQWQLGLVFSAIFAFCGFAGYTMKRVADAYIPLVAAAASLEAAAGRK